MMRLRSAGSFLDLSTPRVMGVLNATPDSFSDGGQFTQTELALTHAMAMLHDGADIIDIGGESTRPGAKKVSISQELDRVIPLIERIRAETPAWISIDTNKPEVMKAAVKAGANMINDVSALQAEGALHIAAQLDVAVCLMHMKGVPGTMQENPRYGNVVEEVGEFFSRRIQACEEAGIVRENVVLDPGFGFGKTLEHNLSLLKHLGCFAEYSLPLLAGLSRKSMIGTVLSDAPVQRRLFGSISAAALAVWQGASIVRVHDVAETVDAVKICHAVGLAE